MPTALFFRPDADLALSYGKFWLSVGVEEAARRGYSVIDLVDELATFETLKETLETEKVDVAILLGHGNANTFTGFQQVIVMQACNGDEIMTGTISHFLSCSVGQELLPSIISKKGVWTVGYQVDFNFMVDTSYPVEQDPVAEPFKDVTVAITKTILDGGTLKEAWDVGIAKCDEWINKLWDRPETIWGDVISCLKHDRDGMIGLGDQEAYVTPPRMVVGANVVPVLGLAVVGYLLFFKH